MSSYIRAQIKATTQPTKVIPKNKFTRKIARVFFFFLIIAIIVGKKYPPTAKNKQNVIENAKNNENIFTSKQFYHFFVKVQSEENHFCD